MKSRRRLALTLAALVSLLLATGLFAQDQDNNSGSNPANDPPARVARIQYISGEVSMQPGGVNDWVAAGLNRPLTTSDRIWTDKDSRTELNVGTAFLRMSSESSLTLTNVGDNALQAQLDQGTLELTVRHLEPGEIFEIDTPNLAFTIMKSGVYRIDVPPNDNQTWVTVRKGSGQATGQGPAVKVNSGEQVRFTGQGSLQHVAYAAPAPDGFEDWAQVRDKRLDGSLSARYVAPGVIGYEDLDYYGNWQITPTYGAIWVPTRVAAGWAPYRYGHWAWINPWGWTWIDDASWGFAPFHYGRWVSYGGGWGWSPGPAYVGWRPYYAPALVGWIGGGGWGFGVSVGFGFGGGCGWFPLGWGEAYYPWYHGYRGGHVSNAYIRNVNITNTRITNINNVTNNYYRNSVQGTHYANRMVAGGVTAAPASALANGQNIARVGRSVSQSELGRGQVVRNIDVTPTRQAMLGGAATRTNGVPPRMATDRPVVTRNTTPAHSPQSQAITHTATAQPAQSGNRPPDAQNFPRSNEARSVPSAPATLGVHSPNNAEVNQAHSGSMPAQHTDGVATAANVNASNPVGSSQHVVPRPPSTGGQAARAERNSVAAAPGSSATAPNAPNAGSQTAARNEVPRPPYAGGSAPTSANKVEHNNQAVHQPQPTSSAPQTRTPAPQSSPAATHSQRPTQNNRESAPKSSANPGTAAVSTPRPPSGNSYQSATAYTAHSNSGANSYSGGSHSYSASSAPYVSNRGSYGGSAPSYQSPPSYSSHMSAPAAPHYSAPSYSGGGYSGGGGGGRSNSSGGSGANHRR